MHCNVQRVKFIILVQCSISRACTRSFVSVCTCISYYCASGWLHHLVFAFVCNYLHPFPSQPHLEFMKMETICHTHFPPTPLPQFHNLILHVHVITCYSLVHWNAHTIPEAPVLGNHYYHNHQNECYVFNNRF